MSEVIVQVESTHAQTGRDTRPQASWRAVLVLAVLAAVGTLAMEPLRAWRREPVPDRGFSVDRAMRDLRALTRAPRPIGAGQDARAYITQQIEEIGLTASVQRALAVHRTRNGSITAAVVENVVTRVRGTGAGAAMLLSAHYDSVPISPGAGDNGAAVAALLETLRCLAKLPARRNDVVVLFTDGEEIGSMGSRAFVDEHPWAKDIRLIVNFDARGSGGPSLMFETGAGTGGLLPGFAEAVPNSVAPGYAEDVYRLLPHGTDFTVFRQLGQPGFNFAFIHGPQVYHGPLDDIDRIDALSLRHDGVQALGLVARFGNTDLERLPRRDVTHFNLPVVGLVVYPRSVTFGLGVIVIAFVTAFASLSHVRWRVRVTRAALAYVLLPLNILAALATGGALYWIAASAFDVSDAASAVMASALVSAAQSLVLTPLWVRRIGLSALVVATMAWWATLTCVMLVYLPASSYLVVLPGIAAVPALALLAQSPSAHVSTRGFIVLVASLIPALLLWIPTTALIGVALGTSAPLLAFGGMIAFTGMLASLVAPQLYALIQRPRLLVAAPLMTSLAAFGCGAGIRAEQSNEPTAASATSVFYALDAPRNRAMWVSFDQKPDPRMSQFVGSGARRESLPELLSGFASPVLVDDAPMLALAAPVVTIVEDRRHEHERLVRMRIHSPRGAQAISLDVESSTGVRLLSVGDVEVTSVGTSPRQQNVVFYAPGPEGFDVRVSIAGESRLGLNVLDLVYGLPSDIGGKPFRRPAGTIAARFGLTDVSIVRHAVSLE